MAKKIKKLRSYIQHWDLQPSELSVDFEKFTLYRDLGPRRDLKVAVAKYYEDTLATIADPKDKLIFLRVRTVEFRRLAAANQWEVRARAYDSHKDRLTQQAEEDALEDHRRRQILMAKSISSKIFQALSMKTAEDLSDLPPQQLIAMLDHTLQIEQKGLHTPTAATRKGFQSGPSSMTREELIESFTSVVRALPQSSEVDEGDFLHKPPVAALPAEGGSSARESKTHRKRAKKVASGAH